MARADVNDHRIDTSDLGATVEDLYPLVMHEVLWALKLNQQPTLEWLMKHIFALPVRKFTRLLVEFENAVADAGAAHGAQVLFKYFFNDLKVTGSEQIPQDGPLILAGNHPGGMDFIAETGFSNRADVMAVTSDVNFFRPLPAVNEHLAPITKDPKSRFRALKDTIQHLEKGGALLLYPTGSIDPDPQFFRNAKEHIDRWSRSLEVYLKKVPEVQIVPMISSNVLHEKFLFNRLVMTQKYRLERQRAAEFLQTLNMMFFKGKRLNLQLSFGEPLKFSNLDVRDIESLHNAKEQIQSAAESLYDAHIKMYPPTRNELWPEKEAVFQT